MQKFLGLTKRKLFQTIGTVLMLLGLLFPSAPHAKAVADFPVVQERPPDGRTVALARLSSGGFSWQCKGYFDIKGGDYIINVVAPPGVGAEKLRIFARTTRAQNALNAKTMTFLGIGTSNGRLCLGLTANSYMGGGDQGAANFAKEVVVWVKTW